MSKITENGVGPNAVRTTAIVGLRISAGNAGAQGNRHLADLGDAPIPRARSADRERPGLTVRTTSSGSICIQ